MATQAYPGRPECNVIHWSRFFSTSALLSLARVGGAATGFLTQILLARMLDPHQLGLFYSISSIATVGALIVAFGYPNITNRFISRYRKQQRPDRIAGFIHRARADALFWGVMSIGLISLAAVVIPNIDIATRLAIVLSAVTIIPIASQRAYTAVAMSHRRFAVSHLPGMLFRPVLFAIILFALWAFGVPVSVLLLTFLSLVTYSLASLSQYLPLRHVLKKSDKPVDRRIVSRWRREAWPLVFVAAFTGLLSELSVLLVSPFISLAEVAAFGICLKIAFLIGFTVQASHQVLLPEMGDAVARGERDELSIKMLGASIFPIAITGGAVLASLVAGDRLLAIFGPEFTSAKNALTILLVVQFVRALAGPGPFLLTMKGAQHISAAICIVSMAVLLAGNALIASRWGAEGAAVSLLLSTLIWLFSTAIVLHRLDGARADLLGLLAGRKHLGHTPAE